MNRSIEKVPSGIAGLDEITQGGLPKGRPSLICGSAGCGKTVMAMQFLVEGANSGENGLFLSFEERPRDLLNNFRSFGWQVDRLIDEKNW